MSPRTKLIRIGGRLVEVPRGDASEKKSQPPSAGSSPPQVAPPIVDAPDLDEVKETPVVLPADEVEPVKKPRRRRKKAEPDS